MGFFSKSKQPEKAVSAAEKPAKTKEPVKNGPALPAGRPGLSFGAETLVLKRPIITEKAMILEQDNKYVFKVRADANKTAVKRAIEKTFKVKVEKVNMAHVLGKNKSFRGIKGHQSGFKKAVVTLAKGEKIEIIPK